MQPIEPESAIRKETEQGLKCPVCSNASGFRIAYRFSTFKLMECSACGFRFVPPSDYLPLDYYEHYKDDAVAIEVARANADLKLAMNIDRYKLISKFKSAGRLLDVGAGWGHFVWAGQHTAFQTEGIEPSEQNAKFACQHLNVPVKHGSFLDMNAEEEFDVVTMWDVLEHINEPMPFVQQAYRVLKSGGIVVIKVPDASSAIAKLSGRIWHNISQEHVNLFGKKTLSLLLQRCGFKPLKIIVTLEPKNILVYAVIPWLKRTFSFKRQTAQPTYTNADAQRAFNAMTKGGKFKTAVIANAHSAVIKLSEWLRIGDEMIMIAQKP
ncbi:MAG: class I SAM-dependent methyltransferase [Candidatus Thermochlorobacter sp.]